MTSLTDKVCVISGGAGGLGQAMARAFAREGARVVLVDIAPATASIAEQIARECDAAVEGLIADAATPAGARAAAALALDRFGGIDVLVNNAGVWRKTPVDSGWNEAVRDFGYAPRVAAADGLDRTIAWFKSRVPR